MYRTNRIAGVRRTSVVPFSERHAAATIGPEGGTISIPGAGLRLVIPVGALALSSRVAVIAHGAVHGFTVTMSPPQPLLRRARIESTLEANVQEPVVLGCTDMVDEESRCSEFFGGHVEGQTIIAHVPHFSGYMWASGINAGEPCDPNLVTDGSCVWVDDAE